MFYTCIGRRTYKIIRLKNVKRQSLSQRHPKREDVVAVTGDRRIIKLEGRGPNPAICPKKNLHEHTTGGKFQMLFAITLLPHVRENDPIKEREGDFVGDCGL